MKGSMYFKCKTFKVLKCFYLVCVALAVMTNCNKNKLAVSEGNVKSQNVDTSQNVDSIELQKSKDEQYPQKREYAIRIFKQAVDTYEKVHNCALKRFNEYVDYISKNYTFTSTPDEVPIKYFWEPLARDCESYGIQDLIDSLAKIDGVSELSRFYDEAKVLLLLRDSIKEHLEEYNFRKGYHGSIYNLANYDFIDGETIINLDKETKMRKEIQDFEDKYVKQ